MNSRHQGRDLEKSPSFLHREMYMIVFMKAVSILLSQITHMYIDFATPKGLKIIPRDEKIEKSKKKI